MKFKVLLFFFLICFSLNSYSQEGFNVIAGLRTSKFIGTEPLGTSNYKLSYTGGVLFSFNSIGTIGKDLILYFNSGFIFESNNTEFKAEHDYNFNTFSSSMPLYISIKKEDLFQFGLGGYGELNMVHYEGDINQFTKKSLPYDFINLIDIGIFATAHYLIPNSSLNIFANYKLSFSKHMTGYQSVGSYGSLSEPFSGFRLQGFSLGIGMFILK
ncbi:MAG: hypothetical protein ACQETL_14545 [Bacteroidota bacterium]